MFITQYFWYCTTCSLKATYSTQHLGVGVAKWTPLAQQFSNFMCQHYWYYLTTYHILTHIQWEEIYTQTCKVEIQGSVKKVWTFFQIRLIFDRLICTVAPNTCTCLPEITGLILYFPDLYEWQTSLEISWQEPGAICISKLCLVHGDLAWTRGNSKWTRGNFLKDSSVLPESNNIRTQRDSFSLKYLFWKQVK